MGAAPKVHFRYRLEIGGLVEVEIWVGNYSDGQSIVIRYVAGFAILSYLFYLKNVKKSDCGTGFCNADFGSKRVCSREMARNFNQAGEK